MIVREQKVKVHEIGQPRQAGKYQVGDITIEVIEGMGNGMTLARYLNIEVYERNLSLLDRIKVGDIVDVGYSVSSRRWTSKDGVERWFTHVNLIDIKQSEGAVETGNVPDGNKDEELPF